MGKIQSPLPIPFIDMKKTLDTARMSQYRLAIDVGCAAQQVNRWYLRRTRIGRLWEKELRRYFNEKNIEIFMTQNNPEKI